MPWQYHSKIAQMQLLIEFRCEGLILKIPNQIIESVHLETCGDRISICSTKIQKTYVIKLVDNFILLILILRKLEIV